MALTEVSLEEVEKELAEAEPKKPRKRHTRADGFDENLPRIQVHLELDAEKKAGARKTFFSKVKEELDIVPAQARVIEYWQEKAVFDTEDGSQQVKAAPRPAHPLGKCLASVQLLAWILVAKRDGPHRLDRDWTKISAFLQDERTAQEKSDEKKATYPFSGIQGQGGLGSDPG